MCLFFLYIYTMLLYVYIYIIFICICIYIYICVLFVYYIYIYVYISCHITRSTAFRWPCVFLMPGKLPMILDVLVPVGFCVFLWKACQCLFYRQQNEKNYVAYTKLAFLWILHSPQLSVLCSQQRVTFFQDLPRTF